MRRFGEDRFEVQSTYAAEEVMNCLRSATLVKRWLTTSWTDKPFTGRIGSRSFEVIESSISLPVPGVPCVLKGTVNDDASISLVTTLHPGFKILFACWLVVVTAVTLTFWVLNGRGLEGLIVVMIEVLVAALVFRVMLHVLYVRARSKALATFKQIVGVAHDEDNKRKLP